MSTIDKSFLPILDNVLLSRLQRCQSEADDELFGCQYAINASINTTWLGHYVHRMPNGDEKHLTDVATKLAARAIEHHVARERSALGRRRPE
jgi:hypothetical protein